jgi:hypothetical protein
MLVALLLALQDGNRLTYLDGNDPYYVHRGFARLTTPQWVGEPDVEAVVTLGIDDMRGHEKWEAYLRPILERLKKIDGRAPVSIMTCTIPPLHEHLQKWLQEGVGLDCHTVDHPCPLLKDKDLAKAKSTYDRCVDLLASVPSNKPVAFRVPCCDSLNTPSPRLYQQIVGSVTEKKNFLSIDSSVFCLLTPKDASLPREWMLDASGGERFRKYIPEGKPFGNTIEDYPFPYVMSTYLWQFPCIVPSDWEAQNLHKPNHPATVEDWKIALDAVLLKQGTFNLCFHPHNWIKPEQVVELIDHAEGKKIKFLTFRECLERLEKNALGGATLRTAGGGDAGVRLLDLDGDGFMDVINAPARRTRLWSKGAWTTSDFPLDSLDGARFGILGTSVVLLHDRGAWRFSGGRWMESRLLALKGIQRLRDVDGDGSCEAVVGRAVHRWTTSGWEKAAELPWEVDSPALRFVDLNADGKEDVVASDETGALVAVYEGPGWRTVKTSGVPLISRGGTDNGAWFHSKHLWVQNEDTAKLKHLVDRRSFEELLRP